MIHYTSPKIKNIVYEYRTGFRFKTKENVETFLHDSRYPHFLHDDLNNPIKPLDIPKLYQNKINSIILDEV